MKIEADNQLLKQRFDSYEKAASILSSLSQAFPNNSHVKILCKLALAKVKRLLAYYNKQMVKVWNITKSPDQMVFEADEEEENKKEVFDYKSDSAKALLSLLTGDQLQKMELFFIPEYSHEFGTLFSQEMVENFGMMNPDVAFEYLSKYQNSLYLKWLKKIMKNAATATHRYFILERLSKFSYHSLRTENQGLSNSVLNDFRITDILYKNIDFKTIKTELLPNNSAYLILQMPPNELFLYVGFMHVNQNREFKYHVQKYYFKEREQYEIAEMIEDINSMKSELQRTPHTTVKDLHDMEAKYNERSREVLRRLEELFSFFTDNLNNLINPIIEEANTEPQPPVDPKAKAAPPKADPAKDKKKPGPGEVQAYASNLPTPTSGIESLVLLVDQRLTSLPWEGLQVFSKVPVISRDFSLNAYAKRLRNIGFKPELNNSQGVSKEKLRYIVYEFKAPPEATSSQNKPASASGERAPEQQAVPSNTSDALVPEAQPLFKEAAKYIAGAKIEGVASSHHVPSLGEWENYLRDSSMLFYFGNPSVLNILSPRIIMDLIEVANVKGYVVFDRINSRKSTIEKFDALEPDPEKVFMHEQPLQTVALLSALGSSFILMNNWPIRPEENLKALESVLKCASEGNYLGRGLAQFKEPEVVLVDSNGQIVKKEEKEDPKNPKKDEKKGTKAAPLKKGETKQEEELKPELKEMTIVKPALFQDCYIYYGVPVVRLA